jgi:hypothetical protein
VVWREVWPKAMGNFVAACKATGARMVFIDNLYMYRPQTEPLVETMPLADIGWKPAARSAATRIWMDAAASSEALIAGLRAPDFYGPGVGNSFSAILRSASSLRANRPCSSAPRTSCTTMPTCRTSRARRRRFWPPRFRFRSGLARSLRPDPHHARHPEDRGRDARREAPHQRPAGVDAGRERNVLAPLARTDRDALSVISVGAIPAAFAPMMEVNSTVPPAVPFVVHKPKSPLELSPWNRTWPPRTVMALGETPVTPLGANSNVPLPVPFVAQRPTFSSPSRPWKRTMFGSITPSLLTRSVRATCVADTLSCRRDPAHKLSLFVKLTR